MLLVALCFVTVLGISLASYVAVCSRAMQISNRTAQTGLSRQLAEMGLEEALRAFNKNDWSDWSNGPVVDWTVSGTTATASLTFPAGTFGQGVTGSVKIRVDNYNAAHLGSTWSSSRNFRINDLVGYNGMWYRCVQNHSNQTPSLTTNLAYWVPAPIPWTWNTNISYALYDVVNSNGVWYRCHTAHTSSSSNQPANTSYWDPISTLALAWSSGVAYTRGATVYNSGTWYYCYRDHTSSGSITISDTNYWAPLPSPASNTWDIPTGTNYIEGDHVYRSGLWYRCKVAHTSSNALRPDGPSGNTYWTSNSIPYVSWVWRSAAFGGSYKFNDVVYYSSSGTGTWYRCKAASVSSATSPASDLTNWENALSGTDTTSAPGVHGWSSNNNYNLGDVVYYNGSFYRCILAHTSSGSIPPTNTTYWTNAPRLPTSWSSTKQYSQNDTVHYNGVWYLSLQDSNTNQNPATATTYWIGANTSTASYQWNATAAYSAGNYKCYGGVWYKCISATTANAGHSPNNTTYWTSAWTQSSGITTGAPVIYAQGTLAYLDGSTNRTQTQLRATLARAPLFPNAIAANSSTITSNSGGTVDSYDSTIGTIAVQNGVANTTTPNLNSGTYASHISTSTNYSALVASSYTAGTAITLSSTAVRGYLSVPSSASSPYAPLYSSGGSVKGPSSPGSPNIDLTRISRSPYIPKFDTIPGGAGGLATNWSTTPKGTALALSTTTNIGTPGATTPSRYYYSGNLTIGTATIQYLNINGPVILYVSGDLFITASGSTGRININNNGSAEIHVTGAFKADIGGEGIQNNTSDPKSLIIVCDTAGTARHFYSEGVYDLYGVVYIPYSTSTDGFYNDNTSAEIFGAVSANKITYSGANMNIHYDTSLRYATFGGVDQPFAITEWRELTDATELATMP